MKRQNVLNIYFSKKQKPETSPNDESISSRVELEAGSSTLENQTLEIYNFQNDTTNSLPCCWNANQLEHFKMKYDGLLVVNQKLGCEYCLKMNSNLVSKEWKECKVTTSGKNKTVQQASLRKKMSEHFASKAHNQAVEHKKIQQKQTLATCIDKINEKFIASTTKVFNTVYSLAKRNRPFSDLEDEIELQVKNVESSTVESSEISPIIFVDITELDAQDAKTIFESLLRVLLAVGFDMNYLKLNLIGFCSDGASVMLGSKSGVSARIKEIFPNVIIWHCLSHRLQLVLDDSINDIKQINHFKLFMDRIYSIFHQSNKNQKELNNISENLCLDIIKIVRVLGPRWASCSLRAALAVWRSYPALYEFFSSNSIQKFSGMAKRLQNKYFLIDLALMIDILQDCSLLSNALQARNINIARGDQLIRRTINAFQILKNSRGFYEKKVDEVINSEALKNINFTENKIYGNLARDSLIDSIIKNMKLRLIDCSQIRSSSDKKNIENTKIYELANLLEPSTWKIEHIVVPWLEAEEKFEEFGNVFKFDIHKNDFRNYLEDIICNGNQEIPKIQENIQKAKNIINTIAVSSAEAERGFSLMNLIITDIRSRLSVKNLSNLMTLNLLGEPLQS
ncbi:E3 SUMO-protein ligase KIAA1586-like [Condylostylus longicornis]|uniref:E3 SUMO-protein ligase KIAA1586-like n=1 Tax=Condylostylus longicornis TaxID=2530218 RepID=UPI00244DCBA1|nr:E3 SUMO-protein ligase KIAA1586-like [Condylostylus longicornis]